MTTRIDNPGQEQKSRPKNQARAAGPLETERLQTTLGVNSRQLAHSEAKPNTAEGVGLVRALDGVDNVAVLAPAVLTPREAKGLEYQTVVVLDAGRTISSCARPTRMRRATAPSSRPVASR